MAHKPPFRLPVAEDDLWQMVVVQLLKQRDVTEAAAELHLRVLEELAFEQQFHARPITRSRFIEAATRLADELKLGAPGDQARQWWEEAKDWQLVQFTSDGEDDLCDLPIPGMGEFFAARYLAARWARADWRLPFRWLRWLGLWCRAYLPPFRALVRRTEHEQTLLLMVGLVRDPAREGALVHAIPEVNRRLCALARSRHGHASVARRFLYAMGSLSRARLALPLLVVIGGASLSLIYLPYLAALAGIAVSLRGAFVARRTVIRAYDRQARAETGLRALRFARARDSVLPLIESMRPILRGRRVTPIKRVAEMAGWIGDARVAPELIDLFTTTLDYEAREALVEIGNGAIEPLLAALKDDNAFIREGAADALGEIDDRRAIEPLAALLEDNEIVVQCAAALALGQMRDSRGVDWLIAALRDPSDELRKVAAFYLNMIVDPRAVMPLIAALKDADELVRLHAAEALDALADPRAVVPLLDVLKSDTGDVRGAAARALWRFGRVFDALAESLRDPDEAIRAETASCIHLLWYPLAVAPLIAALDDPDDHVQRCAAESLGSFRDPQAVPHLILALRSNCEHVREASARALGEIGDPRGLDALTAALEDTSPDVQRAAAEALARIRGG